MNKEILSAQYYSVFHEPAEITLRSPGRINIIGEHTDYNDGFVLPAAIDKAIFIAAAKRTDSQIHLYAEAFAELFSTDLQNIHPSAKTWPNYILGVVHELQKANHPLTGFNLYLTGNLPVSAGVSSSAAVECATVFALNELMNLHLSKIEMVQLAQKAEHHFAGVLCGIMDQFASMMGKKNHAIQLDCRTLAYEYIPLHLKGYSIVLLNTNVKHSLASTAYNERRQQCEQGVALIQKKYPQVLALRDATEAMLDECIKPFDVLIDQRCRFVVQEIQRLKDACEDLKNNDILSLGQKMFATHDGLSNEYEVSCKELDFLVNQVRNNQHVAGARMMGGGFGGCTINIIKKEELQNIIHELSLSYEAEMRLPLTAIEVTVEDGTGFLQ
ncbi:MAG: galactokinase [Chitinophagaceae bacterium]|nr:galactokinase [Chitinophagaceae bacterium]